MLLVCGDFWRGNRYEDAGRKKENTYLDPMIDEINGIITSAGCDRQKGRALEDLYEYQYKHVENPDEKP
jgi:hypothetical protein